MVSAFRHGRNPVADGPPVRRSRRPIKGILQDCPKRYFLFVLMFGMIVRLKSVGGRLH